MLKPGKMGEARRRTRRAEEYLKAGDPSNAELWFDEALALDPNDKKALAGLGKVARLNKIKERLSAGLTFLEQGRLEEAEKELRHALSLEPKNSDAIQGLRQITQLRVSAAAARRDEVKDSPEKSTATPRTQSGESAKKTETFVEYMTQNRLRTRQRNLNSLLISALVHILVFLRG